MHSGRHFAASFDSAVGLLSSLARCLKGQGFPRAGQPAILRPLALAANRLPMRLRQQIYAASGRLEAVAPDELGTPQAERVASWMVGQYPQRHYPAAMIGSPSGAMVHLCAALGIPWLPQTHLIPVRVSVPPDQPKQALALSRELGPRLLQANPELMLHHMHDASQDRLMLQYMSYFRVKRRVLGLAYEAFLRRHIVSGGTLFLFECDRPWPTTRLGPRHVFQHGALGGATEAEYQHGGPRVAEYLHRYGIAADHWDAPQPDGLSPEAEWGFEPALREDVERFAREQDLRLVRIACREPEHASPLVADLYRWWYQARRMTASRLLVESFVLLEPYLCQRLGAVPFWMKFNMQPSLDWLTSYLDERPPFDHLHLMLFNHGTDSIGLPSPRDWQTVLGRARRRGSFIGLTGGRFPSDFGSFARYQRDLRDLAPRYPLPGPLSLAELDEFLAQSPHEYLVQWHRLSEAKQR
jgi:hypothetical protein